MSDITVIKEMHENGTKNFHRDLVGKLLEQLVEYESDQQKAWYLLEELRSELSGTDSCQDALVRTLYTTETRLAEVTEQRDATDRVLGRERNDCRILHDVVIEKLRKEIEGCKKERELLVIERDILLKEIRQSESKDPPKGSGCGMPSHHYTCCCNGVGGDR